MKVKKFEAICIFLFSTTMDQVLKIILIKVDDLEKKSKDDYLMIWYGKERKKVLTSS